MTQRTWDAHDMVHPDQDFEVSCCADPEEGSGVQWYRVTGGVDLSGDVGGRITITESFGDLCEGFATGERRPSWTARGRYNGDPSDEPISVRTYVVCDDTLAEDQ